MKFQIILKSLAVLAVLFHAGPLFAQAPGPRARITFADDSSITIRGSRGDRVVKFQPVGILAGERANIQLKLPSRFANTVLAVQALDGGRVSDNVVVEPDGRADIAFEAGTQPGFYRILLSAGNKTATLQFSVANPGTP
jgi:hypothetical protein